MENNTYETCLICNDSAKLIHNDFPGYQRPSKFKIYWCKNCNTSFSLPRIDTSNIYEKIYKNVNNIPGYNRYWHYAENIKNEKEPLKYLCENEDIYWAINEGLRLLVKDKKTSRILDIGSGLGYFTYALNMEGYNAIGIDISKEAVNNAISRFGNFFLCANTSELEKLFPNKFDVIILGELIEHVDLPVEFIQSLKEVLKPNGSIIITTPNKSFYDEDLVWATELPPLHLWWFSEESIKCLASMENMLLRFINFGSYYNRKYNAINMDFFRSNSFPQPVLNSDGSLVSQYIKSHLSTPNILKQFVKKRPKLLKLYGSVRSKFNRNMKISGERGPTLSAILTKN